jgi:hypothetical protein
MKFERSLIQGFRGISSFKSVPEFLAKRYGTCAKCRADLSNHELAGFLLSRGVFVIGYLLAGILQSGQRRGRVPWRGGHRGCRECRSSIDNQSETRKGLSLSHVLP